MINEKTLITLMLDRDKMSDTSFGKIRNETFVQIVKDRFLEKKGIETKVVRDGTYVGLAWVHEKDIPDEGREIRPGDEGYGVC